MINDKEKALVNLKKAKSLISKIMKMIEEDQYCIDIMQQNLAVMGMLKSSHEKLMKNHLNTCFRQAMETDDEEKKQKMIEEITKVMRFLNK
jgi:DNA-binding FrmR family transcriptional regulator